MSTMTREQSTIARLSPEQRADLDNIAASWRMERMELSDAELEVLARYMLREITHDECVAQMDALQG